MSRSKLILRHKWALGDTILLTALVRDIHRAYPNKYDIQVDTHFTPVWVNNPYVTRFAPGTQAQVVTVNWGDAIRWNSYARYGVRREMKHILAWYHYDFECKTGLTVPVTDPRPDLHLTDEENQRRVQGRYWVVISGGKLDMTTKHWHAHRMQEVVDQLASKNIACVQVGAVHASHIHPPLARVANLIGQTENVRDLWNIIAHSDGVICGVTGAMHIAAAFEKPCVVYAGGREEPWFEAYVNSFQAFGPQANPVRVEHKFLHTLGLLDCCDKQGCWKKRTVPLDPEDLTRNVHTLCRQPVRPETTHAVAKCQDLIHSSHVVDAVMDYYDQRILPPIVPRQNPELTATPPETVEIPQVELIQVRTAEVVSPGLLRQPSATTREQRAHQKVHPQELTPRGVGTVLRNLSILDNPIIGGKITVCVLCYGPHPDLARRCLTDILKTVPRDRLDLRIAANAVVPETLDYLRTLSGAKLYINSDNRHKYPVMRDMFWDEQRPLETNYVLWFDDDTWVVRPNWLEELAHIIVNNHPLGYRMFGNIMYHDLAIYGKNGGRPDTWFRAGSWYRGKNFRLRGNQQETPNGSIIDFAVGWCWALATEAIRLADVPDRRLNHNGGDITIGEQLHQAGFLLKQWNKGKSAIACPSREQGGRRGFSEKFPWDVDT